MGRNGDRDVYFQPMGEEIYTFESALTSGWAGNVKDESNALRLEYIPTAQSSIIHTLAVMKLSTSM